MTRHQVEHGNEPPATSSVRTAATCANTAFAAVRAGAPAPAACHSPLRGDRRAEQAPFTVVGAGERACGHHRILAFAFPRRISLIRTPAAPDNDRRGGPFRSGRRWCLNE